jgi:hypothetical protein
VTHHIADLSHWWSQQEPHSAGALTYRPSLPGTRDSDIAIVGAGYTGLYTEPTCSRTSAAVA